MVEKKIACVYVDQVYFGQAVLQPRFGLVGIVLAAPIDRLNYLLCVKERGKDVYPEHLEDLRWDRHLFLELPIVPVVGSEGPRSVSSGHTCNKWVFERVDSLR